MINMDQYKTSKLCHWKIDGEQYSHSDFEPLLAYYSLFNVLPFHVEEVIRKDQLCYPFFDIEWTEDRLQSEYKDYDLLDHVLEIVSKYIKVYLGDTHIYHARCIRMVNDRKKYSMHITCEDSIGTRFYTKELREIALAINTDIKQKENIGSLIDLNVYRPKDSTLRLPMCHKHKEGPESVLYNIDCTLDKFLVTRK